MASIYRNMETFWLLGATSVDKRSLVFLRQHHNVNRRAFLNSTAHPQALQHMFRVQRGSRSGRIGVRGKRLTREPIAQCGHHHLWSRWKPEESSPAHIHPYIAAGRSELHRRTESRSSPPSLYNSRNYYSLRPQTFNSTNGSRTIPSSSGNDVNTSSNSKKCYTSIGYSSSGGKNSPKASSKYTGRTCKGTLCPSGGSNGTSGNHVGRRKRFTLQRDIDSIVFHISRINGSIKTGTSNSNGMRRNSSERSSCSNSAHDRATDQCKIPQSHSTTVTFSPVQPERDTSSSNRSLDILPVAYAERIITPPYATAVMQCRASRAQHRYITHLNNLTSCCFPSCAPCSRCYSAHRFLSLEKSISSISSHQPPLALCYAPAASRKRLHPTSIRLHATLHRTCFFFSAAVSPVAALSTAVAISSSAVCAPSSKRSGGIATNHDQKSSTSTGTTPAAGTVAIAKEQKGGLSSAASRAAGSVANFEEQKRSITTGARATAADADTRGGTAGTTALGRTARRRQQLQLQQLQQLYMQAVSSLESTMSSGASSRENSIKSAAAVASAVTTRLPRQVGGIAAAAVRDPTRQQRIGESWAHEEAREKGSGSSNISEEERKRKALVAEQRSQALRSCISRLDEMFNAPHQQWLPRFSGFPLGAKRRRFLQQQQQQSVEINNQQRAKERQLLVQQLEKALLLQQQQQQNGSLHGEKKGVATEAKATKTANSSLSGRDFTSDSTMDPRQIDSSTKQDEEEGRGKVEDERTPQAQGNGNKVKATDRAAERVEAAAAALRAATAAAAVNEGREEEQLSAQEALYVAWRLASSTRGKRDFAICLKGMNILNNFGRLNPDQQLSDKLFALAMHCGLEHQAAQVYQDADSMGVPLPPAGHTLLLEEILSLFEEQQIGKAQEQQQTYVEEDLLMTGCCIEMRLRRDMLRLGQQQVPPNALVHIAWLRWALHRYARRQRSKVKQQNFQQTMEDDFQGKKWQQEQSRHITDHEIQQQQQLNDGVGEASDWQMTLREACIQNVVATTCFGENPPSHTVPPAFFAALQRAATAPPTPDFAASTVDASIPAPVAAGEQERRGYRHLLKRLPLEGPQTVLQWIAAAFGVGSIGVGA